MRGLAPDDAEVPGQSARPFLIGCFILLVVLEALVVKLTGPHGHWTDFRVYYSAGYMLRTQRAALYDFAQQIQVQNSFSPTIARSLFIHPSYEALWLAPFSMLSYRAGYLAYTAFGIAILVATFFVVRRLFSQRVPLLQPRPGMMLLFFLPVGFSILWGQDSVLFLFLCALTWRQLQQGKDISAGIFLALALFRFQLVLPIAVLTAARRGWRFSAAFLASAEAMVLLCVALVGRSGLMKLYQMLTAAALVEDQSHEAMRAMGIHPEWMPNLVGILYAAGTRKLASHTAFIIVAVASVVLLLWALLQARREPNDAVAFAMALLSSVMLSYHFYIYDLAFVVLAFALVASRIHYLVLASLYVLPVLLYAGLGIRSFCAFGVPLLGLLLYLGMSRRTYPGTSTEPPLAAPLYT